MMRSYIKGKSSLYDPDLPDASAVMASLLCVATIYAGKPTYELAKLAFGLAETLTAPEYAETDLICSVSKRLFMQWGFVVQDYEHMGANVVQLQAAAH